VKQNGVALLQLETHKERKRERGREREREREREGGGENEGEREERETERLHRIMMNICFTYPYGSSFMYVQLFYVKV
jgi:hypothetical protein